MSNKGNKQWWKDHEQLGFVFERAFRPFQDIHRNTMQRDIVGVLRQLDVGIIEKGQKSVRGFVEIQKRAVKVGMKDFGDWIYKLQTLPAKELVALSEAGFAASVINHVKKLHADSVKLARIHEVRDGKIDTLNTEFLGMMGGINNVWGIAAVFIQTDRDEITSIPFGNVEEKIFSQITEGPNLSLMDIIRSLQQDWRRSQFHALTISLQEGLIWNGKTLKRLMMCVEYQRKILNITNRYFAYDEVYPLKGRRGICVVSQYKLDGKTACAEIVSIPTENDVRISGQITVLDC